MAPKQTVPEKSQEKPRSRAQSGLDAAQSGSVTGEFFPGLDYRQLIQRSTIDPRNLSSGDVLTLQRLVGNRAVSRMLQRDRPPDTIAPAPQLQRMPDTSSPDGVIQRFVSRAAMIKLAGAPSWKAKHDESTYVQILNQLDLYEKSEDKTKVLQELSRLSQAWLDEHGENSPRGKFIVGLKSEAQAREMAKDSGKLDDQLRNIAYAPSRSAAAQAERERTGGDPDWANPKLAESPADKYVFTIAVAVEYDDQLKFAMSRAKSTVRNKVRGALTSTPLFGIRGSKKKGEGDKVIKPGLFKLAAPKSQEQIKVKAARETLEDKGETELGEEKLAAVAERSSEVGHTWVKFKKMVGSELKEVYSYGMWPEVGYGHPARPVPGRVRHPDTQHENAKDEKQLYLDSVVTPDKFNAGLQLAIERLNQKPNYTLTDYNCTAFAREIASKVGVSFPNAATTFPAGPTKAFFQKILNPNQLYSSMEEMQNKGNKGITAESTDYRDLAKEQQTQRERERREAEESMELELAALPECHMKRSAAFWPGERFGDEEPILFDSSSQYNKVWKMADTKKFMDPDLGAEVEFAKVKAIVRGRIVIGWIHADSFEELG